MTRILLSAAAALTAIATISCCCTSEPRAPHLRKQPRFQELPVAPQYEVVPTK